MQSYSGARDLWGLHDDVQDNKRGEQVPIYDGMYSCDSVAKLGLSAIVFNSQCVGSKVMNNCV